jgi:uncharacterized protein with von Willebrand factor type A (vWA) domain
MNHPRHNPGDTPPSQRPPPALGGLIHSYQKYDPKEFPSPTAPPPDIASGAFEHMLMYGNTRDLTDEELARAVRIDPSMFPRLGPSIDSLIAMLEERKRKILEKYEADSAQGRAAQGYQRQLKETPQPPAQQRPEFDRAARAEQLRDLERLWYRQKDEHSDFARALLRLMQRLGEKYQVDELAGNYEFTGREPLTVPEALEVKQELETIDKLLEQLREAMKNARIGIIDLEELSQYADPGDIERLNQLRQQIEDYLRQQAELQGLERTRDGYRLTPKAYRLFQGRLLEEIFSTLQAARSGRHEGAIVGDGAVELTRTKPYEFGDSVVHMDVPQTVVNAIFRQGEEGQRGEGAKEDQPTDSSTLPLGLSAPLAPSPRDIDIHLTRNTPKCATCVLLDMSGSMRYDGQYINVKRMGLALDGLIRAEYPGDFVQFIEVYTFARARHISEIASLLPRPVSVSSPSVRLRADMSDPNVSESRIPQHFTNIQRALQLARRFLGAQDTPNRQVILLTDGLPTAHFEDQHLYLLYPPDPRTEEATMREAMLCAREGICINIFLLPNWAQSHEDVQFAQRMAQATKGRVFFTGGRDLDRFVLWDYVSQRRKIIG